MRSGALDALNASLSSFRYSYISFGKEIPMDLKIGASKIGLEKINAFGTVPVGREISLP
jgi:hypothetical protein